jgi:hypothetical protein
MNEEEHLTFTEVGELTGVSTEGCVACIAGPEAVAPPPKAGSGTDPGRVLFGPA